MLLTVFTEKTARPVHASLVHAKVSQLNSAWMGNVALAATSQGTVALVTTFVGLASARMATAQSSFPLLLQRTSQAPVQLLLFLPQLPHRVASALTDLAVAPTSTFVKARHLATAVALQDSAARPLAIVRQAARLPSAHAQTLVYLLTVHAEAPTNTNARDLGLVIAAVPRVIAVQPLATVQRDARLGLEPTSTFVKARHLATAVAHLVTVD